MVAAEVGFRVDANKPNGEAWRRYWMSLRDAEADPRQSVTHLCTETQIIGMQ